MTTITIAKGDYGKALSWTLYQADGVTPFVLTGYAVKLNVWLPGKPESPILTGACIVTPGESGVATYTIASTDFVTPGTYWAEFEATKSGEKTSFETFEVIVEESV
jgi:hypothetical protein